MNKKNIIGTAIMFILFILLGAGLVYFYQQPVSYVGIDINPSVQLAVNRLDRVVEVVSLNRDAELLVSDLNLLNKPVEKALEVIVDNSIEIGYIDEFSDDNMVVVSALEKDDEATEVLEEKIQKIVTDHLDEKKVPAIVLMEQDNEERRDLADSYGVSYGSLLIAQKTVALNPELSLDEIINDPVNVNAKRMSDAHKEIKRARSAEKEELSKAKEMLKKQNQEKQEARIKQMMQEADQAREEITEKNMEQYKTQIIENKKEELMDKAENLRNYVEKKWNGSSDQPKNNQDNKDEDISIDIQEKVESIKGKWSSRKR